MSSLRCKTKSSFRKSDEETVVSEDCPEKFHLVAKENDAEAHDNSGNVTCHLDGSENYFWKLAIELKEKTD